MTQAIENKRIFCPTFLGQNAAFLSHGTNRLYVNVFMGLREKCPTIVPWDSLTWDSGTNLPQASEINSKKHIGDVGQNAKDHSVCPTPPIPRIGADGTVMGHFEEVH